MNFRVLIILLLMAIFTACADTQELPDDGSNPVDKYTPKSITVTKPLPEIKDGYSKGYIDFFSNLQIDDVLDVYFEIYFKDKSKTEMQLFTNTKIEDPEFNGFEQILEGSKKRSEPKYGKEVLFEYFKGKQIVLEADELIDTKVIEGLSCISFTLDFDKEYILNTYYLIESSSLLKRLSYVYFKQSTQEILAQEGSEECLAS